MNGVERFNVVPIPDGIHLHDPLVRLDEVDGCLALIDGRKQNYMKRLWILKEYENQRFMASPQISLSLGSSSSKSSGSHSSHSSGSNSNSGVQRIPKKRKRCGVRRERDEAIEGDEDDVDIEIDENPAERSYVWLHFRKIKKTFYGMKDGKRVVVDEIERAQCVHCETNFACDSHSNGTITLERHIEIVCKHYPGRVDIEGDQQVTGGTKELVMGKWTQQGCREAAVKMIVMDELPYSHIEKEGFKYFCRYAVPHWKVPSRRIRVGKCMQKRILSFKVIPNHQGTSIGKLLEDCLLEWEVERVLTILVDNASANKVAIDYIREKMLGWEKELVLGDKFLHVWCLAHILNLIVRLGHEMMGDSVASIRNAVWYVRSSGQRLEVFKMCLEKELYLSNVWRRNSKCVWRRNSKKVCILDVLTRWNSTYLMLSTALELRKAFDRMVEDEEHKY
ncbi:PREDICTED: uncharacterized protein LOC101305258 [Fragaria vesca subsp. vesca]